MCSYPDHIVPKPHWKSSLTSAEICSIIPDAVIGRRFDMTFDQCIVTLPTGKQCIRFSALNSDKLIDLSTNLLGAGFELSHVAYRQINDGKAPWLNHEVIEIENETANYTLLSGDWTVAGWMIRELDHEKFPYQRPFNVAKEYSQYCKRLAEFRGVETLPTYDELLAQATLCSVETGHEVAPAIDTYFLCVVCHHPTRLNFWHYTLHFYPEESPSKEMKKANGWRERALDAVWDRIRKLGKPCLSVEDYAPWPTWEADVIDPARASLPHP